MINKRHEFCCHYRRQTYQHLKPIFVEPRFKSIAVRIFPAIIIICFFGIISCMKLDLGTEVRIRPEETYYIDYFTSFQVDSVKDYRCPVGVECFWSGDVDIFMNIKEGSMRKNVLARLYSEQYNPVVAGNYKIKVLDVLPHLKVSEKPDPSQTRIIIRIDRN
jgi:hypothetical protein